VAQGLSALIGSRHFRLFLVLLWTQCGRGVRPAVRTMTVRRFLDQRSMGGSASQAGDTESEGNHVTTSSCQMKHTSDLNGAKVVFG